MTAKNSLNDNKVLTIAPIALTASSVLQAQATPTPVANQTSVWFIIFAFNRSAGNIGYVVNEANNVSMTGETAVPAAQVRRVLQDASGVRLADAATLAVNGSISLQVEPSAANSFITVDIQPTGFTGSTGAFSFTSGLLNP